jgi:putative oxidoreductase
MPADLLLLFARLLVCTVFIVSAVDKFNLVPAEVAAMRALKLPAPVFLMRLTVGVCEIVGCLMLGLGIMPRIAAVAFALFTLLVTLLFLRFWNSKLNAPDFLLRRNTFFSNLAMIGALLYIIAAGPGIYSLM